MTKISKHRLIIENMWGYRTCVKSALIKDEQVLCNLMNLFWQYRAPSTGCQWYISIEWKWLIFVCVGCYGQAACRNTNIQNIDCFVLAIFSTPLNCWPTAPLHRRCSLMYQPCPRAYHINLAWLSFENIQQCPQIDMLFLVNIVFINSHLFEFIEVRHLLPEGELIIALVRPGLATNNGKNIGQYSRTLGHLWAQTECKNLTFEQCVSQPFRLHAGSRFSRVKKGPMRGSHLAVFS